MKFKIIFNEYCPYCLSTEIVRLYDKTFSSKFYCRDCIKTFDIKYYKGVHILWLQ